MIELCVPNVGLEEQENLIECIRSSYVSSVGPFVNQFETVLADIVNAENVFACNSGTSALHLSLLAVGVKPEDLVLTSDYSFIATANAISYCGAKPWLVDIEKSSFGIDPELLENSLAEDTDFCDGVLTDKITGRRVSAIVVVIALGYVPNIARVKEIASKYRLPVVLDAAGGLGSQPLESTFAEYADVVTYSFNGNKIVTSGGGGATTTNSREYANFIRHIGSTARVGNQYVHDQVGFNFRMTNIQAAVGVAQLGKLNKFLERKKQIRETYQSAFQSFPLDPFLFEKYGSSSNWISGIILKSEQEVQEFTSWLNREGINSRDFWQPIHQQSPYANARQTLNGTALEIWKRLRPLPSSTGISQTELHHVVDTVKRYFNR